MKNKKLVQIITCLLVILIIVSLIKYIIYG